jgi:hypothetical protein
MSQSTRRTQPVNPSDSGDGLPHDSNDREPNGTNAADISFDPAALESPEPRDGTLDPFDPETYKVRQSLAAAAGVKKVLTELPVYPPNKAWWVRCHPSPEYAMQAWVLELKDERETFLVLPPLWGKLVGEACFKPKAFYLAVTMQGKLFLWPVRVPADDTKEPDRWMKTPLEAVRLAKEKWTRMSWNEQTRQHDVQTCESTIEPEWPEMPFRSLVELAFKDYVIRDLDHPVLKRLRGEVQ